MNKEKNTMEFLLSTEVVKAIHKLVEDNKGSINNVRKNIK